MDVLLWSGEGSSFRFHSLLCLKVFSGKPPARTWVTHDPLVEMPNFAFLLSLWHERERGKKERAPSVWVQCSPSHHSLEETGLRWLSSFQENQLRNTAGSFRSLKSASKRSLHPELILPERDTERNCWAVKHMWCGSRDECICPSACSSCWCSSCWCSSPAGAVGVCESGAAGDPVVSIPACLLRPPDTPPAVCSLPAAGPAGRGVRACPRLEDRLGLGSSSGSPPLVPLPVEAAGPVPEHRAAGHCAPAEPEEQLRSARACSDLLAALRGGVRLLPALWHALLLVALLHAQVSARSFDLTVFIVPLKSLLWCAWTFSSQVCDFGWKHQVTWMSYPLWWRRESVFIKL